MIEIAAADKQGIAIPHGLENVPLIGPWVVARWQSELGYPGALLAWTQRTDPAALLGWAQSLAQFTVRHAFIIGFTTSFTLSPAVTFTDSFFVLPYLAFAACCAAVVLFATRIPRGTS